MVPMLAMGLLGHLSDCQRYVRFRKALAGYEADHGTRNQLHGQGEQKWSIRG